MKQTYTGGCHCGAIRYQADIDLSQGSIRCNCSICKKVRAWLIAIGEDDFRLLEGGHALSEYRFGTKKFQHLFCKHCGIKSFVRATAADGGTFVAIFVNCLENVPDADLAEIPVMYVDGRNDDFQSAPAETRYL